MPLSRFGMGLCSRRMEGVTHIPLDLSGGERFAQVGTPLGLESMGCRVITLDPRQRARVHRHREQEELYVVLEGELTLVFEGGEEITVRRHGAVRIGPPVRRQLVNRGSDRVQVLAVGAAGPHEARDGEAFTDWSDSEPKSPLDVPMPDDLPE